MYRIPFSFHFRSFQFHFEFISIFIPILHLYQHPICTHLYTNILFACILFISGVNNLTLAYLLSEFTNPNA